MPLSPYAGQVAPKELLIDVTALQSAYYDTMPDQENPQQRVSFGTSGHRGTSFSASFNEAHILAVTQAVCDYRNSQGITGPLYLGIDSHALSDLAQRTAVEVLAANNIRTVLQADNQLTPTPVVSHAILNWNRTQKTTADGIVVTPSHNPPQDGGFKYNPPSGGPAGTSVTSVIEARANELLEYGNNGVKRLPHEQAVKQECITFQDYLTPYIEELPLVVDIDAIRNAGLILGADPMGGTTLPVWQRVAEMHDLNLEIVNTAVDPTFAFMRVDHDGKIRMDCSSPYAMAGMLDLRDKYDVAFGNDTDGDRHGIVTRKAGLLNPNHYLAVAIEYLFTTRFKGAYRWPQNAAIGKTLVSSSMIDRVGQELNREVYETPVGFKWFVDGMLDGSLGFGGEESAGASFLRFNGGAFSTDKDGIIMCLLAAEITATTGDDPSQRYQKLTERHGTPIYRRVEAPANPAQKSALKQLRPDNVKAEYMAGEQITAKLTQAPGNGDAIGGLKVTTENGWFAARPSGTEDIYKIYAESFKNDAHLEIIIEEAQALVGDALRAAGV